MCVPQAHDVLDVPATPDQAIGSSKASAVTAREKPVASATPSPVSLLSGMLVEGTSSCEERSSS